MASVATDDLTSLFVGTLDSNDTKLNNSFRSNNDDNDDNKTTTSNEQGPVLRILKSTKITSGGRSFLMIDVRCRNARITPKEELLANFIRPKDNPDHLGPGDSHCIFQANSKSAKVDHAIATRRLPTEILYDKEGLTLFDDITQMESMEYYLTACEENIFENQMDRLIPFIPDGAAIIELGCGTMAKTAIFLDALRKAGKKDISFYAIDIEQTSLQNSIEDLLEYEQQHGNGHAFQYFGILGSYDQALGSGVLKQVTRPKVFLWLGSSIGNCTRNEAVAFLRNFSDNVMQPFDLFMIGIDLRNDPLTVARAYNDSAGITKEFGLNGLRHLNKLLGHNVFDDSKYDYFAGYNIEEGRHEAYFISLEDQTLHIPAQASATHAATKVHLGKGELINYEFSYKYNVAEIHDLCDKTRFHLSELLFDSSNRYSFAVLSKAVFDPVPRALVGRGMFPQLSEFEQVWKLWHSLTSPAVIRDPLEKPIDLRHPLLFYVGHIPAFEDIYQSRYFEEPLTEPTYFATIFERGINPVVEDPTQCHPHSEVPDEWPDIDTVRAYDLKVHDRIRGIYERIEMPTGLVVKPGMHRLGRQLAVCLEHTIMHAETFIYMLVQLKRELLPKSFMPAYLRSQSHVTKPIRDACWVDIQAGEVKRGIANLERNDDTYNKSVEIEYGWDNETPVRSYKVQNAFQAQSRPVTCGEYFAFLHTITDETQKKELVPASWSEQEDGSYALLTMFGPIEVARCVNCPVALSYKLAEKYRDHLCVVHNDWSVRLPSEEEWVVMQSQLKGAICHEDIDFMNWMPAPLKEDAHHTIGSVWEWTSTVFDSHEGFEQSQMYPGYSQDFFDGLHNVVRGASWCTHARVANRIRNFYQRSYPYAFIGARYVRDIK